MRGSVLATPSARRSRVGVATIFCLNGFLAALWVAHIPVITARTGTGPDLLGGLLLLVGGAAFAGMQVCGHLIDRLGSRPVTTVAALALCPAVLGPVVATNPATLAVAVAAFGFVNGSIDVSMNAQAVAVERLYGRPIMSAFHGCFSVGGLAGSGAVAVGLLLDLPVAVTVAVLGGCGLLGVAAVCGSLVTRTDEAPAPITDDPSRWWHEVDRHRLVILALVAFAVMLAEGTAYDWSALHVVETFDMPEAIGALAFGSFSGAMTVARFVLDPIAGRCGPVAVVRGGALIGIAGMGLVLWPATPGTAPAGTAIAGWTLFGIGVAGLIPQVFTAAGGLTRRSAGRAISMVVGCGYLGMLAGPAVVGAIGAHSSLRVGLTPVLATLGFAALAAGVVRMRPGGAPTGDTAARDTLEG
ncbi:MAG: MFS transporter [Gordonia sp. (in: high G+C Gram-positive bacteria)]